jgi:hypothetical protein
MGFSCRSWQPLEGHSHLLLAQRTLHAWLVTGKTPRMQLPKMLCSWLLLTLALFTAFGAGAQVTGRDKAVASVQSQPSPDQGPSYDDTTKWIQDHIQDAGIPGWTDNSKDLSTTYDDETYGIKFDGCNAIHLLFNTHNHTTASDPSDNSDSATAFDIKIPFKGINRQGPNGVGAIIGEFSNPVDELTNMQIIFLQARANGNHIVAPSRLIDDQHHLKTTLPTYPGVAILLNDNAGTISHVTKSSTNSETIRDFAISKDYFYVRSPFGAPWKAVVISFGMVGTDDAPEHMAKALNHLMDVCNHPEAAPKDIF